MKIENSKENELLNLLLLQNIEHERKIALSTDILHKNSSLLLEKL